MHGPLLEPDGNIDVSVVLHGPLLEPDVNIDALSVFQGPLLEPDGNIDVSGVLHGPLLEPDCNACVSGGGGGGMDGEPSTDMHITCLLKNVMSIMTEVREQLLFAELESVHWDIVILNETWRESKSEIWTSSGHLFLGAGGLPGSCGVAVLLHNRLARGFKSFHRISERLCAVDVDVLGESFGSLLFTCLLHGIPKNKSTQYIQNCPGCMSKGVG